jgi:hypothetical protein
VSTPKSCVGGKIRSSKRRKTRTRRKIQKKRVVSSSRLSDGSFDNNPTFRASVDEAWFDSNLAFETDCDDDFHSVQEGTSKSFNILLLRHRIIISLLFQCLLDLFQIRCQ